MISFNGQVAGWIKVLSAGAAAVGGIIIAAPLDFKTGVVAICAFLASASAAATALVHPAGAIDKTEEKTPAKP